MALTEKQKYFLMFLLSISILVIDQFIKLMIRKSFEPGRSMSLIPNIFHLTYVQNTGAGFGLFSGNTSFIIFFSLAAIALIIYFYRAIPSDIFSQAAAALIIGGSVSNLIDRIVFGYVIDFIDFRIWPVFNIADMAITAGILILAVYLIKKK